MLPFVLDVPFMSMAGWDLVVKLGTAGDARCSVTCNRLVGMPVQYPTCGNGT